MRVIWSPIALRHIAKIFEYIDDFSPTSALKVSQELIAAGDSLANFSGRGRPVRNTDMRELITVYPYIIRYRITRDAVRILRVRHTARRPTTP